MTPEGKVKADIKKGLDKLGAYYFMPVQTGYGKKTVDFLCCIRGRFVAIEAKAGKNKPTPAQQSYLIDIVNAKGVGVIAYSWDDVKRVLDFHGLTA